MIWSAHRHAPARGTRLCRLDDVKDGECLEVRFGEAPDALSLVVMRSAGQAWAYVNVCPHFSLPLNSQPNAFLVTGERRVMCAYHCAIFRFDDGLCVEGPAEGLHLDAVPVHVVDGEVLLA